MSVTVSVHKKTKKVLLDLGDHDRRFKVGIREALHDIGKLHVTEIRRLLDTGPKTGRTYKKPGRPPHQASAPGQAPATETGDLAKSADYKARTDELEVGETMPYAKVLEDGGGRIKPRPHVVVAANNIAGDAVELLEARVVQRIGRS